MQSVVNEVALSIQYRSMAILVTTFFCWGEVQFQAIAAAPSPRCR